MPYGIVERENEYCIFKLGPDGKPMGETLGCHPDQETAQAQQAALYASETKAAHTGAMVALMLDPATAQRLAIPGGEPAEDLHITLAYLGEAAGLDLTATVSGVAQFAQCERPVFGRINGFARFVGVGDGAQDAIVLLYDSPQIPEIRHRLCECLGIDQESQDHGFIPHITLAYVPTGTPEPDGISGVGDPLAFDRVTLALGDQRFDFPLKGEEETDVDEYEESDEESEDVSEYATMTEIKAAELYPYTYNGVEVMASRRRPSSRNDKKYERDVQVGDRVYLVHYGDPEMDMQRDIPESRESFLSRHSCDTKRDPRAPGFWACYDWYDTAEKSAAPVVFSGSAVKALGDGRVGGYLVYFGDPAQPDLTGDYFTKSTDFGSHTTSLVFYQHGMDGILQRRVLDDHAAIKIDDVGVWIEAQLKMRDEYERAIYRMAEAGKLGWSSGTAPHLIERRSIGNGTYEITRWPLGIDASLTPTPAEPRAQAEALKTFMAESAQQQPAQAGAEVAAATPAAPGANEPGNNSDNHTEGIHMDENEIKAVAAAVVAQLQPPANPGVVAGPLVSQHDNELDKPLTPGEFFKSVADHARNKPVDKRFANYLKSAGSNELVASDGGVLVSTDVSKEIWKRAYEVGQVMARCFRIPVSTESNSTEWPAISETSRADGSRYGGIQAYWAAEGATVTATKPKFENVKLKLDKLYGLCYATEEILADAAQLQTLIMQIFPEEISFKTEAAIMRGDGVGKPLGILNSPALVTVAAEAGQAAGTLLWENVVKMWSRCWGRSRRNAAWYINQDIEPQLYSMSLAVGTGGQPVYMPAGGASGEPYATLFGRPVIPTEYNSTLGTVGDIVLADMSQYALAEKGGVQMASSMHVRFLYDEQTFRFTFRVDGQPFWRSALTPYQGTNTLSPFIVLATR